MHIDTDSDYEMEEDNREGTFILIKKISRHLQFIYAMNNTHNKPSQETYINSELHSTKAFIHDGKEERVERGK
eukprot:c12647_g1_i1 orf=113-331(+)